MLTVCCVKQGDKYDDRYVQRLRNSVARNLSFNHRFVCFTENDVPDVECLPLPCDLKGWWSKVGLFRDLTNFGVDNEPILYTTTKHD